MKEACQDVFCCNRESLEYFRTLPFSLRFAISESLANIIDTIRLYEPEVVFTSGYRSPAYNRSLSGSSQNSYHQYGCAVDCLDLRDSTIQSLRDIHGFSVLREKDHVHLELVD